LFLCCFSIYTVADVNNLALFYKADTVAAVNYVATIPVVNVVSAVIDKILLFIFLSFIFDVAVLM